jgi:hypothetical protein
MFSNRFQSQHICYEATFHYSLRPSIAGRERQRFCQHVAARSSPDGYSVKERSLRCEKRAANVDCSKNRDKQMWTRAVINLTARFSSENTESTMVACPDRKWPGYLLTKSESNVPARKVAQMLRRKILSRMLRAAPEGSFLQPKFRDSGKINSGLNDCFDEQLLRLSTFVIVLTRENNRRDAEPCLCRVEVWGENAVITIFDWRKHRAWFSRFLIEKVVAIQSTFRPARMFSAGSVGFSNQHATDEAVHVRATDARKCEIRKALQ